MPPETSEATTGATPGTGATPAQGSQPTAPAGATPAASTTGTPPATTPPATGDDGLGDNGKRILAEARRAAKEADDRAKAAEAERDTLKAATLSDSEKAISQARREASAEATAKWTAHIRDAEIRGALRGAGIPNDRLLGIAVAAPEFRELKVSDTGTVEGLEAAVEAFKKAYPEMLGAKSSPAPGGPWDGSAGGGAAKEPKTLEDAVAAHYQKT